MTEETKIINAPERIWLQVGDDFEPGDVDFNSLSEVTWCQDNVHSTDIEYVRVPPGYKLVPIQPNQAMCQAGQYKAREWPKFPLRIAPIWQAMVEATPTGDDK